MVMHAMIGMRSLRSLRMGRRVLKCHCGVAGRRGRFGPRQRMLMARTTVQHGGCCEPLRRDRQHHQPDQSGMELLQHGAIIGTD